MKLKTYCIILISAVVLISSCKKENEEVVIQNVTLKVDKAQDHYDLYENVHLKLDATYPGAISYLWWPTSETTPIVDNAYGYTEYKVTITTADTILVYRVYIDYDYTYIYIPTAFTPNGDGKNDTWRPRCNAKTGSYFLRVYNNDNFTVFETANVDQAWDGKYDGTLMPYGVYYYYVSYETKMGIKKWRSGMVEMME